MSIADDESDNDNLHSGRLLEQPPAYSISSHTPHEETIPKSTYQHQGKSAMNPISLTSVAPTVEYTKASNDFKIHDDDDDDNDDDDDVDDDDDDDDGKNNSADNKKLYDETAMLVAPFGSDEKELFLYLEAYTAETIRIEPLLKPFLLDYIPAVGDVDAFIKIPRPDEVEDNLGLTVLDEPALQQSDPIILGMQLRSEMKDSATSTVTDAPVKKLERADKNTDEIERWIQNIKELHRTKPPDTVHYSKPMPNIEQLMQEWPAEIENMLKIEQLPSASLDVTLEEYVDITLALLDIPVQKSRIQALHVLFTLFSEFRNSQHFRKLIESNLMSNTRDNGTVNQPDRLVL